MSDLLKDVGTRESRNLPKVNAAMTVMYLMVPRSEHVLGHSGRKEGNNQGMEHRERHVVFITLNEGSGTLGKRERVARRTYRYGQ